MDAKETVYRATCENCLETIETGTKWKPHDERLWVHVKTRMMSCEISPEASPIYSTIGVHR